MCKVSGFYYVVVIVLCILVLFQFTPSFISYYIWGQNSEIYQETENGVSMVECNTNLNCNSIYSIIVDSSTGTKLEKMGGTGQWYHLAESLFPSLHMAAKHIWKFNQEQKYDSNHPLVIAFERQKDVENLSPFGKFLTVAVLTGGYHRHILFGYVTNGVSRSKSSNTIINTELMPVDVENIVLHGFVPTFGVDLDNQDAEDLFVKDAMHIRLNNLHSNSVDKEFEITRGLYANSLSSGQTLCSHRIKTETDSVHWEPYMRKDWIDSVDDVTRISSSMRRVCPAVPAEPDVVPEFASNPHSGAVISYENQTPPPFDYVLDDALLAIPKLQKWGSAQTPIDRHDPHKLIIPHANVTRFSNKKVLFYLRDTYRKLVNAESAERILLERLNGETDRNEVLSVTRARSRKLSDNTPHEHGCLRNSVSNSHIMNVYNRTTHPLNNNRNRDKWITETIVHTNTYPPCRLMQSVSTSTAIITPHGFQSTLLLFQPVNSLFVEIFPKWFYKPFVYGSLQAGLRHLNISRSYLCEESISYSWIISTLAFLFGQDNNHECGAWMVCRYIAKGQDVRVTTDFVYRIADYLKMHFQ